MTVENPPPAATVRFQTSGHFVQALDGNGNPQTLADAVADGLGGGSAVTRTASISTLTGNGTVAAGKKFIEFVLASDFVGTIGGVAWSGATDTVYGLPYLPGGDTYAALAYTISAGSARLTTIA